MSDTVVDNVRRGFQMKSLPMRGHEPFKLNLHRVENFECES
jgi:hypothetical protein